MARLIWRVLLSLVLAGLAVVVGLGAASDLLLQRHQGQVGKFNSVALDEREAALAVINRSLALATDLAPWDPRPYQAKLNLAGFLTEQGVESSPSPSELRDIFLETARRAPTWPEPYLGLARMCYYDQQTLEVMGDLWPKLLAGAERLNPTMAYIQHLWGNLLFKTLPVNAPPPRDKVAEICAHFGRGLTLQGDNYNWPLINDAFSICFGLTRDMDLLKPVLPVTPGIWQQWGTYLGSGPAFTWRRVRPQLEALVLSGDRSTSACLALARGLGQNCMEDAVELMMTCLRRHPDFAGGWAWLLQNVGQTGARLDNELLSELVKLALNQPILNAKQVATLAKILCERSMFDQASMVLEGGLDQPGRHDEILDQLADCLESTGQAKAAIDLLERVLGRRPNAAWAWLSLGRLQLKNGEVLAGEESLSRALKIDPQNQGAIEALKRAGVY